ncbi:MAG: hypothetical protein NC253_07940 [Ruminococcus sp.]|nr:hypothetical protein [Ruminococcus sp.]MCM1380577.1 hypothetical protein [Muribaculaceae bacterium]MCM1479760.1 hypothetical protein [Muribaculaceae bacterium]
MLDVTVLLNRRNGTASDKPNDSLDIPKSLIETIEKLQSMAHTHDPLTNMKILTIYKQSKEQNIRS